MGMMCNTLTDREIVQALIVHDEEVTRWFFFVKCRPLLMAIMRLVYSFPVEYDEMVNELYANLMANNAAKLRQFAFRSTLMQWLKVVAIRFFIRHRSSMIENSSQEPLYLNNSHEEIDYTPDRVADCIDLAKMLRMMNNTRYADVIRALVLEDRAPDEYAAQIGVTVDNLYNIKKRAMTALAKIALKYYSYGK